VSPARPISRKRLGLLAAGWHGLLAAKTRPIRRRKRRIVSKVSMGCQGANFLTLRIIFNYLNVRRLWISISWTGANHAYRAKRAGPDAFGNSPRIIAHPDHAQMVAPAPTVQQNNGLHLFDLTSFYCIFICYVLFFTLETGPSPVRRAFRDKECLRKHQDADPSQANRVRKRERHPFGTSLAQTMLFVCTGF